MYDVIQWLGPGGCQVDLFLQVFVELPHEHDVLASDDVQAHRHLLDSVLDAEHSFMALLQDDVDRLVETWKKGKTRMKFAMITPAIAQKIP